MKLGELDRKASARPLRRNSAHQRARSYLWNRVQGFLRLVIPNRFKPRAPRPHPASAYVPPRLTRLTTEQAKLKLLGHLSVGDQGAKDLLDLLFREDVVQSATREPEDRPVQE